MIVAALAFVVLCVAVDLLLEPTFMFPQRRTRVAGRMVRITGPWSEAAATLRDILKTADPQ